MRVVTRADLTLDAVRRVAWEGDAVAIAPEALAVMDRCHASFAAFVEARIAEDPGALIYGVTTAPGDGASVVLSAERAARRPRHLWTAASFGEPLPERVTRGIVLARLANFLEGHAAVRGEVALAVAGLLDRGPLPAVPAQANGGAGEILALGHLFLDLSAELDGGPKERMALINGSPCAAALVADAALAGRGRLALAERVLALAADALGVPLEHYAPDLEALWGDEHEAAALRSLRALLADGAAERQLHQAPVSFRILPRVLGGTRRAQAEAEAAAGVSLAAVTDNPVYLPPDAGRPLGAVISTGGYHDTRATSRDRRSGRGVGRPLPARPARDRQAPPAPRHRRAADPGRVDAQAAAHGAGGLGGGGARARSADAPLPRRLRAERRARGELPRVAQGDRGRRAPRRGARGARGARLTGPARRRTSSTARAAAARRRRARRVPARRGAAAARRRRRGARGRVRRARAQRRVAST